MNANLDGDGIDDMVMGIPQGVSTGDLIQTSKSREDGYRMGEPEIILSGRNGASDRNGASYDDDDEKESDEPDIDSEWVKKLENVDIIDDPVRMYLREIGRVGLLKAADERKLAREMEEWKHIEKVEEELQSLLGRRPRAWQTIHQFMINVAASEDLLGAFCRYYNLPKPSTLYQMLTDEALTECLDGELGEEMLNFIAEILNREPDDVKEEIRELSLNSRLLPDEIHDIFEVSPTINQLSTLGETPGYYKQIETYELAFTRHISRTKIAGRRAQRHLAEGKPAPCGQRRQEIHRQGHVAAGPHSGRQHRAYPRGREVRLSQGLQVQHLCDMVDSAGDNARDRGSGAHHPHTRAHGRDHQQAAARQPPSRAGIRQRADQRRDWLRHGCYA